MNCPKCHASIEFPYNKVPFRATCSKCDRDLHSCMMCKHYQPGKPNDCNVPNSLTIRNREAYNFCEDYDLAEKREKPKPKKTDFHSLFKDDHPGSSNGSSFDDLFK